MAYRRRAGHYSAWHVNQTIQVTFTWNSLMGAYDLKFDNVNGDSNWKKVLGITEWIKKTFPYGERDWDEESKVWAIDPKHFNPIKCVLNGLGSPFNVVIVEKPVGGPAIKFTPMSVYFDIFKTCSGEDISSYSEADFNKAKRIYFKTSMKIHPDKGGDTAKASEFNEAWDVIKERHFKIQRVMAQMEI